MRPGDLIAAATRARHQPRERSAGAVAWRLPASMLIVRRGEQRRVVRSPSLGASVVADLGTPLGLGLYRYGVTDPVARFLSGRVPRGGTFVDGGANIGIMTAAVAHAVGPDGRVVAFEASPGTCDLLRRTVAANQAAHVEVVQAALSDRVGEIAFSDAEPGSGTASIAADSAAPSRRVRATTLDDELGDRHVDLLKLDVEGAEVLALTGARRLLTHQRPALVIEVEPAHLARFGHTIGDLRDLLSGHGYVAHGLAPGADGALRPVELAADWSRPAGATENYLVLPR